MKISKYNIIIKEISHISYKRKYYEITLENLKNDDIFEISNLFKILFEKKYNKFGDIIIELKEEFNNIDKIQNKELKEELKEAFNNYFNPLPKIKINNYEFDFNKKTYIMGILNVTPDSFYDGGKYLDIAKAKERAEEMIKEGADIIDVGGESTRPGSERIKEEEELRRVIPVIKEIRKHFDIPISIDTYKERVAEEAINAGANLINDISGLVASNMVEVAKKYDVPVVIMHIMGNPKIMQKNPVYEEVISDIIRSLRRKIEYAEMNGIKKENIIIDPGIGFGKTLEHNCEIIKRLKEFKTLGKPILVGPSRKSFIGKILDLPVEERLEGTLAIVVLCIINGANILRVHDVKEVKRVAKVIDFIKYN